MKTVPCEGLFTYVTAESLIKTINEVMADTGYSDIRLALAKENETPMLSVVDNVVSVAEAKSVIFFTNSELSVHNSLLMDYSVLLTGSPSSFSHQTMHILLDNLSLPALRRYNKAKTRFCAFIQRHPIARRDRFVQKLQRHKKVDCPGACLNNCEAIGSSPEDAMEFMSGRKFTVTFENSVHPDYITEKIYMALSAGSVPIYSGSPTIARYVNPEAFINVDDFPTEDEAIAHIIRVDRDPRLYERYLNAEPILENSSLRRDTKESLALFIKRMLDNVSAGQKPRKSYFVRLYRRVYRFFCGAYYSASIWAMEDGEDYIQGIPLHRMLFSWRIWLKGIPFVLKNKAADLAGKSPE